MATPVSCEHCAATFAVAEEASAPWVECPRCRGRVANPALRVMPVGFTVAGALGALLLAGGCLSTVCGGFPLLWQSEFNRHGSVFDLRARVWIATTACLTTIVAGAVLLGAVEWM